MRRQQAEREFQELEWLARYWGRRYSNSEAERDELTQEARIALWDAIRDWRPGGASLRWFATTRIRGRLGSRVRSSPRDPIETPIDSATQIPAQDEGIKVTDPSEWARVRVEAALKHLTVAERAVIDGRLKEMTLNEISDSYGMSREWVRIKEVSAMRRLKRLIQPDEDEPTSPNILHRAFT